MNSMPFRQLKSFLKVLIGVTAIKKALRTRIGLTNLILSVLCILALLALNGLDIGRWTFLVFMVPALASVYFGDRFVKVAVAFMEEELDKKDPRH